MTLEQAADAFEQADGQNIDTAANLLVVAYDYWADGRIMSARYAMYVRMVANDLLQMVEGL